MEGLGRSLAPDLIGMGDSDKLPVTGKDGRDGRYRFVEHRRFLDAFLEAVSAAEDILFVIHDWGSALGFDWARRHPDKVRGLTEAEMENYRRPYVEPGESRRATLTWPREVPFDGEPADTHRIIADYAAWLPTTVDLPKLWFDVSEGVLVSGARRNFARSLPAQTIVQLEGRHFVQNGVDCRAFTDEQASDFRDAARTGRRRTTRANHGPDFPGRHQKTLRGSLVF